MSNRRDYLKECNNPAVALEQFQAAFCVRCMQPECTRSQFGTSRFDRRVSSWRERLITNPPTMDVSDPRFAVIAAKQFRALPVIQAAQPQQWVDPSELPSDEEASPDTQREPAPLEAQIAEMAEEEVPETQTEPAPPTREVPTIREAPPLVQRTAPLGLNTPIQRGIMLPGAHPSPPKAPEKDPWVAPTPADASKGTIVKRGAKVRLGGGGGVE